MRIDSSDVGSGKHDGEYLYISDIRLSSEWKPFDKLIRHVKPQKVYVRSNNDVTTRMRMYRTVSHFAPLGRKGQILKKIIPLCDNTNSYSPVNIFTTMQEAVQSYIAQRHDIQDAMSLYIAGYKNVLNDYAVKTEELERIATLNGDLK